MKTNVSYICYQACSSTEVEQDIRSLLTYTVWTGKGFADSTTLCVPSDRVLRLFVSFSLSLVYLSIPQARRVLSETQLFDSWDHTGFCSAIMTMGTEPPTHWRCIQVLMGSEVFQHIAFSQTFHPLHYALLKEVSLNPGICSQNNKKKIIIKKSSLQHHVVRH